MSRAVQLPEILFLVNGESSGAMGIRARSFAQRLDGCFRTHIDYRSANKVAAIFRFLRTLVQRRPAVCYVLDMGFSGVLAAGFYRALSRCRIVVDSGDAIYELSRLTGNRGRLGLWMTRCLEQFALSISHRLVVRSHPHQELLAKSGIDTEVIPDGVDTRQFRPEHNDDLRRRYGLDGFTVIGLLGSLIWNPRWKMCYGWELIEILDQLRDRPVKGLVIGDGSGLAELKAQCEARGLADRILFVGRIPYDDLPPLISLMDICLSTQTNDMAGQVRTTGKLPLYLACGRFVLASEVGEAARVLPREMLVPYHGTRDDEYPSRLTARVLTLLSEPERFRQPQASVLIAQTHFDYDALAERLRNTVRKLLSADFPGLKQPVPAPPEL